MLLYKTEAMCYNHVHVSCIMFHDVVVVDVDVDIHVHVDFYFDVGGNGDGGGGEEGR